MANIEDSDEIQHYAAFHQGLYCLIRLKQHSETEIQHNLECYKIQHVQFHIYCINMYGKSIRIQMVNLCIPMDLYYH